MKGWFQKLVGLIVYHQRFGMGSLHYLTVLIVSLVPMVARADNTEWQEYVIPDTGAKVDIPVSIFTEDAGPPKGVRGGASSPVTTAQT